MYKTVSLKLRTLISSIDWRLLIFLLLCLNVKLVIKLAAILLVYFLRPDFKFGFSLKNSRIPLFYISTIAIVVFNWVFSGMTGNFNYFLVVITGLCFWLTSILAIHQVKLSVDKNEPAIIHRTILVFFILNALVSIAVYLGIILETGRINPFSYQGDFQRYFVGTGDYIKGITLDTSITNAVINSFGVIFYLVRRKYLMVLLCMAVLLLTGSNVTNLMICLVLVYLFVFKTVKDQKSIIVICLMMGVVFLTKVSPQNNKYIKNLYERLFRDIPPEKPVYLNTVPITAKADSILSPDERKQKIAQLYLDSLSEVAGGFGKNIIANVQQAGPSVKYFEKPVIPRDSIHTPSFQHKKDTSAVEKKLLRFAGAQKSAEPTGIFREKLLHIPGKILALQETYRFFIHHPIKLFTGLGIGNFSSKLAFRVTAMKIAGGYPGKYSYINNDFKINHLNLFIFYFTRWDDLHSIANSPNSVYDQLWSEYGIAGLIAFFVLYLGFFVRRLNKSSYGFPVLLMMTGIFFVDYWFEQLSVVILFELILFLDIKETSLKKTADGI